MPQDGIRIPCNQWITCSPSPIYSLICSALAESSPGLTSWATYMGLTSPRDNSRSSIPPRGDMFSAAIRISQSSLPRTGVLGYSQPSLAGLLLASCRPRTYVLGYSQDAILGPFQLVGTHTL